MKLFTKVTTKENKAFTPTFCQFDDRTYGLKLDDRDLGTICINLQKDVLEITSIKTTKHSESFDGVVESLLEIAFRISADSDLSGKVNINITDNDKLAISLFSWGFRVNNNLIAKPFRNAYGDRKELLYDEFEELIEKYQAINYEDEKSISTKDELSQKILHHKFFSTLKLTAIQRLSFYPSLYAEFKINDTSKLTLDDILNLAPVFEDRNNFLTLIIKNESHHAKSYLPFNMSLMQDEILKKLVIFDIIDFESHASSCPSTPNGSEPGEDEIQSETNLKTTKIKDDDKEDGKAQEKKEEVVKKDKDHKNDEEKMVITDATSLDTLTDKIEPSFNLEPNQELLERLKAFEDTITNSLLSLGKSIELRFSSLEDRVAHLEEETKKIAKDFKPKPLKPEAKEDLQRQLIEELKLKQATRSSFPYAWATEIFKFK